MTRIPAGSSITPIHCFLPNSTVFYSHCSVGTKVYQLQTTVSTLPAAGHLKLISFGLSLVVLFKAFWADAHCFYQSHFGLQSKSWNWYGFIIGNIVLVLIWITLNMLQCSGYQSKTEIVLEWYAGTPFQYHLKCGEVS